MNLSVTFNELNSIIRSKTGKEIAVEYINSDTVKISTTIKVQRFKILGTYLVNREETIGCNITVLGINGCDIRMQYEAGWMANKVISHLSSFFLKMNDIAIFGENRMVTVHLDRIDQLKKTLRQIELNKIEFTQEQVALTFSLK